MGSFSVGERNKMLDAVSGRADYTAPVDFYAQLHIGDPGAAGTSNIAAHTTRVIATFGSAASAGAITTTADTTFTALTANETITFISFWSASSGGTFLGSDDITAAAVVINDELKIPTGDLDLAIT
jgi:hypothetical protein